MDSRGFTLLELLVSMTVIGILTAIAIPQYQAYQKRAFDVRAQTDLQTVALAEELYFLDYETYFTCKDSQCADGLEGVTRLSQGVLLEVSATTTGFVGTANHPKGTGRLFTWRSDEGGLLP